MFRFYFDFLSPYTYLVWREFQARNWHREYKVDYRPVILASIIHNYHELGPSEIDAERNYNFKDCLRKARDIGVPFTIPAKLPFNSTLALRIVINPAIGYDLKNELIDRFFKAAWEDGLDISSEETIKSIMKDHLDLIEFGASKDARRALKENVKDAISSGAFGLPTFVLEDGELFWGRDPLDLIAKYMKGEDNIDLSLVKRFKNFPIGGDL